jgi:hypothetical protein
VLPRRTLWGWWVPEQERGIVTEETAMDGQRWLKFGGPNPYYLKLTLENRWGPGTWYSWLTDLPFAW